MIAGLKKGDVVSAEKIDRSRCLPLPEAEKLIATIKDNDAVLAVLGLGDLAEVAAAS